MSLKNYPDDLREVSGVGSGTVRRISLEYPTEEELVESLRTGEFSVSRVTSQMEEDLRELLDLVEETEIDTEIVFELDEDDPPVIEEVPLSRPVLKNIYGRGLKINYRDKKGPRTFVLERGLTVVPEEHDLVLSSPHFKDLLQSGRYFVLVD